MSLPVRLRSAAETDVAACAHYLSSKNQAAALKFLDAFDHTLAFLQKFPEVGGRCNFRKAALVGIRVWTVAGFTNYQIYDRMLADEIEIVRVLHSARDVRTILAIDDS